MKYAILFLTFAASLDAQSLLNQARQKHTHNSYQRDESLLDQLTYYAVRSLELDIHSEGAPAGDWKVYHLNSDTKTSCNLLSECLAIIGSMHTAIHDHEAVTIWVELKQGSKTWNSTHTPAQFDALLATHLLATHLYTPGMLLGCCPQGTTCTTLQTAIKTCGWPALDDLRAKYITVLLPNGAEEYEKQLGVNGGSAFIQGSSTDFSAQPNRIFYNSDISNPIAAVVNAAGYVSRVTTANSQDDWNKAYADGFQYLGTDKVNFYTDSWSRTNNPAGGPFRCGDECTINSETQRMVYIDAVSGDIDGKSDNFTFLYEQASNPPATSVWSAVVSTPDSNAQTWSKGCLMARASTAADAAYFAVCRSGGDHPLRVQYRTQAGGSTTIKELDRTYSHQYQFMRLAIVRQSGQYCYTGSVARVANGPFQTIHTQCLTSLFGFQGIAGSAHDDTVNAQSPRVRFLFINLERDGTEYGKAQLTQTNVGKVASTASAGDGFFPGTWWFTYQTKWGDRTSAVANSGVSQFTAKLTNAANQDYVYDTSGNEVHVLLGKSNGLESDAKWGVMSSTVADSGRGQWFANVDGNTGGRQDLVYNPSGGQEVHVLLSTGAGFGTDTDWGTRATSAANGGRAQWLGDINNDGKADFAYVAQSGAEAHVLVSTGTSFNTDKPCGNKLAGAIAADGKAAWLRDINGDGRADLLYAKDGSNEVRVLLSTGDCLGTDQLLFTRQYTAGYNGLSQWLANVDSDPLPDFVYGRHDTKELRVLVNRSGSFSRESAWGERMYGVGYDGQSERMADLNGDGRADHIYNRDGTREYWGMLTGENKFGIDQWWGNRAWGVGWNGTAEWFADITGTGRTDQMNERDNTWELWAMKPVSR